MEEEVVVQSTDLVRFWDTTILIHLHAYNENNNDKQNEEEEHDGPQQIMHETHEHELVFFFLLGKACALNQNH